MKQGGAEWGVESRRRGQTEDLHQSPRDKKHVLGARGRAKFTKVELRSVYPAEVTAFHSGPASQEAAAAGLQPVAALPAALLRDMHNSGGSSGGPKEWGS